LTTPFFAEILPWDTNFFGFRVARVRGEQLTEASADQIDAWCGEQDVRCLYFLCDAAQFAITSTAEQHGFHFVDLRMTLDMSLDVPANVPVASANIRPANTQDIATLQRIAGEVHRDTRFSYDPNFPDDLVSALYQTWIKVDIEGKAEQVLVAEEEGVPVGYVTCHLDPDIQNGRIGLVGVDNRVQGKGLGRALILNALEWFRSQQMRTVSVVTQGRNYAAQRLYQRCGFRTQSIKLWYHKWFSEE
jgi:dTDP-4-amino-4,6-dideoxy-D-galactose acyltransferase